MRKKRKKIVSRGINLFSWAASISAKLKLRPRLRLWLQSIRIKIEAEISFLTTNRKPSSPGNRWTERALKSPPAVVFAIFLNRALMCKCGHQMVKLGFYPSYYAAACFEPTSGRVAPNWDLWRMLYRLSYCAVACLLLHRSAQLPLVQ